MTFWIGISLSVLIGGGGIAVSILLFLMGRRRVRLELLATTPSRVISPTGPFSQLLSVNISLGDGRDLEGVTELWQCTFSLRNSGNVDIVEDDFGNIQGHGRVMIFSAPQDSDIEMVVKGSSGIEFQLSNPNNDAFTLEPLLLKHTESINFSVLSRKKVEHLSINARIAGVDEIKQRKTTASLNIFDDREFLRGARSRSQPP